MTIELAPDRGRRGHDPYDGIESTLKELAALPPDCAQRRALRDDIVRRCLPLADHIARRYAGRGETYDDLHQIASVGLVLAIDRFDPARGDSFLAFAVPTIMGEVRRHFRDYTWSVRVPRRTKETQQLIGPAVETLAQRLGRTPRAVDIALKLGVDMNEVVQALLASNAYRADSMDARTGDETSGTAASVAETVGSEDPEYELTEQAIVAGPLLAELPEDKRQLLYLRFFCGQTQSEIAKQFGVSQMHISRLLAQTLATLREHAFGE
ncbi:SigB/SigF/SigG family RNA polymerase sigma factor [Nocardia blacklockiae]|uniref:SigB/SigF/SigG family RNA polymerase sigma factor n=1 Tax=Nocardia blacklockiae TaxID=480036 RepID=UPI00189604DD|nr:SigB/SigF/SigG family RNA polymerase sigma factor [Nocardia blacklockiae]MBF6170440.1 SigB/SigF/SigG family RNA polymerase sigma factor [Nocardia blacklockiae]